MKVLYLSTSFPPFMEAHTIRNIHYMNKIAEEGHEVCVCAPKYYGDDSIFKDALNKKIQILYTKLPFQEMIMEKLKKASPNGLLMKVFNVLINKLFPDSKRGWNRIAYKQILGALDLNQFDAMVSASGSYTAHILAAKLKKKNNKLKWIAEYGDPWGITGTEEKVSRAYNCELKLLQTCNRVVFTTQETIDLYVRNYGFSEALYTAIYGGYDSEITNDLLINNKSPESIRVAYIGVAYRTSRNLEHIIQSVKNIINMQFCIIGRCSEYFKKIVSDEGITNVKIIGQVPYSESIRAFKEYEAFILVGNQSTSQIPSKIYNYLASCKPIIYIEQMEDIDADPTRNLLKKFPGILFCRNSENEVCSAMKMLADDYTKYYNESLVRVENKDFLELSWDSAAKKMLHVIIEEVEKE